MILPSVVSFANSAAASWLLVFDDVERMDFLEDCWTGRCSVIIASRDPGLMFQIAAPLIRVELSPLTSEEAIIIFKQVLGRTEFSEREVSSFETLIAMLGGLPLAIVQIAAFMRERHYTCEELLKIYKKHEERIFKVPSRIPTYQHTLETVWMQAFMQLSKNAMHVLRVLSVLDPDRIEVILLRRAPRGTTLEWATDEFELVSLFPSRTNSNVFLAYTKS